MELTNEIKAYRIYVLSCPLTSQIKYVGLTYRMPGKRLITHLSEARNNRGCNMGKNNWIRTLMEKSLLPTVEEVECLTDLKTASLMEQYWISQFKSWGFDLLNISHGGYENRITSHSTKLKLSLKRKGSVATEETKARMSLARKGKKHNYKPVRSGEYMKGLAKKRMKAVDCFTKEGVLISTYESASEASRETNTGRTNIAQVLSQQTKTAGGFIWKYRNQ